MTTRRRMIPAAVLVTEAGQLKSAIAAASDPSASPRARRRAERPRREIDAALRDQLGDSTRGPH